MGAPREGGFPRTTELMRGVDYIVRKAVELRRPVAINISFGNTYGSHDGTSLVERFLNDIADMWKNVICIGMRGRRQVMCREKCGGRYLRR